MSQKTEQSSSPDGFGAEVPSSPHGDRHSGPHQAGVDDDFKVTTGLKLVTISPDGDEQQTLPHMGERSSPRGSKVADAYLGCTIDNRYKVEEVLGEGGMGIVYGCRHKIIDKRVAMKVLRADLARDTEVMERFLIEARAASAIGHEHIIDISDFGQLPDGSTYFVMEYLDGTPLTEIAESEHRIPATRIVHIARQLANGLAAAHAAGIIHRDLKPDNIYLIRRGNDPDFVKILDFGIAKVSTGTQGKLTRAGSVFGTPHYMSPEQAAGAPVDHRGDIYSLGVILYELCVGAVPFDADNFMGILTQHMYKAPTPISQLPSPPVDVPPGLEAMILKCLSKRPEERYQSMGDFLLDLEELSAGGIPGAVQDMLSREGTFTVPEDYFQSRDAQFSLAHGGLATPLSGGGSRWPLYAALAGLGLAVGLVVVLLRGREEGIRVEELPREGAGQSSEPAAATSPADQPSTASSKSADAVMISSQVVLTTKPSNAKISNGDKPLGSGPVTLTIPEGDSLLITVSSDGYQTQTVDVDGSQARREITLVRKGAVSVQAHAPRAAARPAPPPAPEPEPAPVRRKKSALSGGDIHDPWSQ